MTRYTGLAAACAVAGGLFWVIYSRYNKTEESMNELEKYVDKPVALEETGSVMHRKTSRSSKAHSDV